LILQNDHRSPDNNTSRKGEHKEHLQNSLAEKISGILVLQTPLIIEEIAESDFVE